MKIKSPSKLVASILLCQLAGIIGSLFTVSALPTWYASLVKPGFSPPSWVFAPVWTILYTLMGAALYLIWIKGLNTKGVKPAVVLFGVQLVLNALWPIIFFWFRLPFLAFVEILLLICVIILTIKYFYAVSKPAAYLMVPYFVWVCFAAVLNYSIWLLNS